MIDDSRRAHQSEDGDPAVHYEPWWTIPVGHECVVGVLFDDHCLVFLVKDWSGQWTPTTHVPVEAVRTVAGFFS
jgi:hypothetical protein